MVHQKQKIYFIRVNLTKTRQLFRPKKFLTSNGGSSKCNAWAEICDQDGVSLAVLQNRARTMLEEQTTPIDDDEKSFDFVEAEYMSPEDIIQSIEMHTIKFLTSILNHSDHHFDIVTSLLNNNS